MNKIFVILIFSIFLSNCSLNENSRIWNKKEKIENENKVSKKILTEKEIISTEFNPLLKLDLSKNKQNNKIFDPLNNFGSSKYNGQLNKVNQYKFSKLENFNQFNFEPLILDNGVIVFEKKGTIIRFNDNKKVVWKNNFYSKTEKKIHPTLSFAMTNKNLLVADSIAKVSSINLQTGNLIWSKKSEYPFNSEIKIFKDKFFVVDFKNTLRCFYIKDGTECWNIKTEDSFTVSNSKFSMLIKDNLVIYNNSLGDITAVDISSGLIEWQLPTQKSSIMNETYSFNFSKLVSDGSSIYFSNNKNQFYSVDLSSGTTNWMSEINSILTPIIIGNFIFTVSENGYLFTIKKNEGKTRVVKNFFDSEQVNALLKLYKNLPVEIFNKRQNIMKKKWSDNFEADLQKIFIDKLKVEIGDFFMDNPKTKDNLNSLGLFQESFSPVSVHADTGFNFDKVIYKQTLMPLTSKGETVIFKNKFYGNSTNFTIDENELKIKKLNYGQNLRSSKHLEIFEKKPFKKEDHERYLQHEKIENLSGLEIDLVYEWELGSMLIFDRTRLHCSSSIIDGKKIGLTTFTKK